jgi:DNA-binding HxlR family transcriptional regulator
VSEPHENHITSQLVHGLYRYRWAQPVLFALAEEPLRYRDLMVHLAATGRPVHPKTLGSSLRYLRAHALITRRREAPHIVVYTITTHGRTITTRLAAISRIAEPQPDNNLGATQ